MNTTYPQLTSRPCHECGSFLILVEKITEFVEGEHLPVTTSRYKCSNQECQDDSDKKTVERLKITAQQEVAKKNRQERIKASRQAKVLQKASL